jgi:hypothetical protein
MSQAGLQAILEQLITDHALRERMDVDPEGSVGGHELTADEQEALLSWDPGRIEAALGAALTPEMMEVVSQMGPSILQGGGATPTYEPPPQTPGGRLGSDGYRHRTP